MRRPGLILALLALFVLAGRVGLPGARDATPTGTPVQAGADFVLGRGDGPEGVVGLGEPERVAGLRFAPEVHPADRQVVLGAIGRTRPQARRLIELVDGLTTVRVGPTGRRSVGQASAPGNRRYEILLDLAEVSSSTGPRGVDQLIIHELAHVVDFALVSDALVGELDEGIPRGYSCEPGQRTSACAPREERFAETFAKWARADVGHGLYIGYAVSPPASLETWALPLARLAG